MKANYKKLWHILLDRDMKKKELAQIAGVSTYTINKLNKNENVTVEVLGKICRALNCTLDDIMEFEEDEKQKIATLQAKIRKEKQFNKQMQMNTELKKLKKELEEM